MFKLFDFLFPSRRMLARLLHNSERTMTTAAEINAKVQELRAAVDLEQEQITAAFAALDGKIADLTTQIVEGGTKAERQQIADDLAAAIADVKSTIADAAPPVPEPLPETETEPGTEPLPEVVEGVPNRTEPEPEVGSAFTGRRHPR